MPLTKEKAKELYQKAIDAGYSDEEAKAAIQKRIAADPAPKKQGRDIFELKPGEGGVSEAVKMAANSLQQSYPGQYVTGLATQLGETGRGMRQLFNKLTGDEEELSRLNEEERQLRARDEALTSSAPIFAGAGKGAGMMAPMLLGGGAGAVTKAGPVLNTIARVLSGAAGGAVGGGAQALTPEEEASGQRELGAATGAVVGGTVPAVTAGLGKLAQALRKVDPDEALQDFAATRLGASRGGENLPAYQKVGEEVSGEERRLRDVFKGRYSAVENNPDLPKVDLTGVSETAGGMPFTMSDEVAMALSPTARRVVEAAARGSTHTSPILSETGKNIQIPKKTTFSDVRETIRELRRAQRVLSRSESTAGQSAQLGRIEESLKGDLDRWAANKPELQRTLQEAVDIDTAYRQEVVPFASNQTSLGRYGKTDQYDEKTLDRIFMDAQSGQALQDILRRVPGAKDPLRQIYGSKLLQARGKVGTIRQMEGGTAGEALLTRKERDYLVKVADALRQDNPSDLHLGLINKAMRMPGIRKVVNSMMGVEKFADQPTGVYNRRYLLDALRGAGAAQLAEEE